MKLIFREIIINKLILFNIKYKEKNDLFFKLFLYFLIFFLENK
jgi:hypothetical protein